MLWAYANVGLLNSITPLDDLVDVNPQNPSNFCYILVKNSTKPNAKLGFC
jgi:hypothetical protein